MLSKAKDLTRWASKCFTALSMTNEAHKTLPQERHTLIEILRFAQDDKAKK